MRDDLDKILCERERPHSWDHYSNYRNLDRFERQYADANDYDEDDELAPVAGSGYRESMKYRYGWSRKTFGEHLNPLYGFIRKSVGRKWDKVYSELSKTFDPRSVTGQHILQHAYDRVVKPELTFIGPDGKPWVRGSYYRTESPVRETYYDYYVDPRDGILKHNVGRLTHAQRQRLDAERRKREEDRVKKVIDSSTELRLINDVWFEIKFREFNGGKYTSYVKIGEKEVKMERTTYPLVYDVLLQQHVQAPRVAVEKRSANHKMLKKYGLAA